MVLNGLIGKLIIIQLARVIGLRPFLPLTVIGLVHVRTNFGINYSGILCFWGMIKFLKIYNF